MTPGENDNLVCSYPSPIAYVLVTLYLDQYCNAPQRDTIKRPGLFFKTKKVLVKWSTVVPCLNHVRFMWMLTRRPVERSGGLPSRSLVSMSTYWVERVLHQNQILPRVPDENEKYHCLDVLFPSLTLQRMMDNLSGGGGESMTLPSPTMARKQDSDHCAHHRDGIEDGNHTTYPD